MAGPNGFQRLQIYNDAPTELSGRLLNEAEMDFHLLNNTMGVLLDNPSLAQSLYQKESEKCSIPQQQLSDFHIASTR